ncbi:hypothetical protein NEOLEDRAFT_1130839 [Neolentinus lepideus HHB14362 ss-1]|uniref:EH domain-containing protein n=1 Tax=Neolentinus lepideus HHB14362 ss-1 TaxID=1314782 RepID=A0A165TX92_9AGAM|nr:hypothetical protein NEOLEDRAFT_1130839 [Neolentinus lepideus HHB14362 ss-1]
MAPSTALQSRINAFESLGGPSSISTVKSTQRSRSRSPSNPLDKPISPTATTIQPITPSRSPKPATVSPSPSPPNLGRKTSLIDLKEWVVDDGPAQVENRHANGNAAIGTPVIGLGRPSNRNVSGPPPRSNSTAPLISFESHSPPRTVAQAPPLPPRNPSKPSIRPTASAPVSPPSLVQSQSKDSLTVGHHYPPLSKLDVAALSPVRKGQGHVPASSVSSFHSISLSSDGGTDGFGTPTSVSEFVHTYPMDRDRDTDTNSLDGSYENVSVATSLANSPVVSISHDWEINNKRTACEPPKLPRRPAKPPSSPISSPSSIPPSLPTSPRLTPTQSTSSSAGRRPPPPPPPIRSRPPSSRTSVASFSDRSSILSTATSTSRTSVSTFGSMQNKLLRPTPVPVAARRRYEKVFIANVLQSRKQRLGVPSQNRKNRSAAGWRGLSVDLITSPEPETPSTPMPPKEKSNGEDEDVGPEERLDGHVVRWIWLCSKLDKQKLKDLWSECDPNGAGSLDRDAFVKGMWRIDEELRRAQLLRQTSSGPSRSRLPPRRTNTRPVLR